MAAAAAKAPAIVVKDGYGNDEGEDVNSRARRRRR
jgi:hypothetical protein